MVVETAGIQTSFNWTTVDAPDYGLTAKKQLSPREQEQVKQLKALDKQVRDHEQEHLQTGGALVRGGGAKFEYTYGPDGKLYAARGGVEVDSAPIKGDPKAALDKAEKLRKTALAAGLDASNQDRQVADSARKMVSDAYSQQESAQSNRSKVAQAMMAYSAHPTTAKSTLNVHT